MESLKQIVQILLASFFTAALIAIPLQFIWNSCLVETIDGIHPITFWQSTGIYMMSVILFKDSKSTESEKDLTKD